MDNGSITYELKALNQLGWMAIGFGSQSINTEMVIVWQNLDGSNTLSQRHASGLVEPTPLSTPQRPITTPLSSVNFSLTPTMRFGIASQGDTVQDLIWAFATVLPDPDPSSTLQQHLDAGNFTLDFTKSLADASSTSSSETPTPTQSSTPSTASVSASAGALGLYDRLVVAHGLLLSIGFLFILPLSALAARWGRSFASHWYEIHYYMNVVLGIPVIIVGWALGPLAVAEQGWAHFRDIHQIIGLFLFLLYILQLAIGALAHRFRKAQPGSGWPYWNVVHVVLGVSIAAVAFFETRSGFTFAWKKGTSRPDLPGVVPALWTAWIIILPILYIAGLALLPRQLAKERARIAPNTLPLSRHPSLATLPLSRPVSMLPSARTVVSQSVRDDGTQYAFSEHTVITRSDTSTLPKVPPPSYVEFPQPLPSTDIEMRQVQTILPVAFQLRQPTTSTP
ncbi:hypothetical protein PLICRDRAFT_176291 [Plicaturopsis crispa FD-325 SS-3]|nr:hypothetical protein PLICRDRAFT_176291 [Plicaturopsis crispa FD-325 SS-3]